jgi:hypothetical protein
LSACAFVTTGAGGAADACPVETIDAIALATSAAPANRSEVLVNEVRVIARLLYITRCGADVMHAAFHGLGAGAMA